MLRKIYAFLFQKHDIGFMLFCYAMLIPCAMSDVFCRLWMLFMSFVLTLAVHAKTKSWNRSGQEDGE